MPAQNIGTAVINAVIKLGINVQDADGQPVKPAIFVWPANAEEQLEAAVVATLLRLGWRPPAE